MQSPEDIPSRSSPQKVRRRAELIAACCGRESRRMGSLVARSGWIEEVQEDADRPISCRDADGERADNRQQEHAGEKQCCHYLFSILSDAPHSCGRCFIGVSNCDAATLPLIDAL